MTQTSTAYTEIAYQKRKSLLSKIPAPWILSDIPSPQEQPNVNEYLSTVFPPDKQSIVSKSATELIKLQKDGKLTASQICDAYCHRSALVHQLTSCCTEIFYEAAFATAAKLDAHFQSTGELMGPLHGIPISLKDQVNLPGITTSMGYLAPHISPELESIVGSKTPETKSHIATILENAGAVFYVKTTVPMAMLSSETESNLGPTLNSLNRLYSTGGSSGGEGALISGLGSVIGLGTDIGGSIRGPCSLAGLYGLRSSSNRFPYLNVSNSYPNQVIVCSVIGPMCRFIEDVDLIAKVIIDSEPWLVDAKVPPIPYRPQLDLVKSLKDLNVGIMYWDGELLPHPPILRTLKKLNESLREIGADVVELQPPVQHSKIAGLLTDLYTCDDFEEIKAYAKLSNEPLPDPLTRTFTLKGRQATLNELFGYAGLKYKFQQTYDEFWNGTDKLMKNDKMVDCLIIPGWSCSGWFIGDNMKVGNSYTRFLNVLDYSVITVPLSKVKSDDTPFSREASDDWPGYVNENDKVCWEYYNHDKSIGMPVTLQVVCRRYNEEKCIRIAQLLKQQFGDGL